MSGEDDLKPLIWHPEHWMCEDAAVAASNAAYDALGIFESLEHAGKVRGNGHHMRQEIAKAAADLVRERWVEPS